MAAYEAHPAFPVYKRWPEADRVGPIFRRYLKGTLADNPTLDSIDCHLDRNTCLLTSRVPLGLDRTSLAEGTNALVDRRRWFKNIRYLFFEAHYKTYTYFQNEDGEQETAGPEHYVDYNFRPSV
ncbi:hypothetical protein ACJ41O_012535 [Fusarium nematophilum]